MSHNKLLTNLTCSNRTKEYCPAVVFVRTSLHPVCVLLLNAVVDLNCILINFSTTVVVLLCSNFCSFQRFLNSPFFRLIL